MICKVSRTQNRQIRDSNPNEVLVVKIAKLAYYASNENVEECAGCSERDRASCHFTAITSTIG